MVCIWTLYFALLPPLVTATTLVTVMLIIAIVAVSIMLEWEHPMMDVESFPFIDAQ